MKVVVVEDEVRIREGIVSLLKRQYPDVEEVREARNGLEGTETIRAFQPDLVITDIRMDGMDGLEMLDLLRKEGHTFAAVILSAYSEFDYAKKALGVEAVEYLVKPIDLAAFQTMMGRVGKRLAQRKETPRQLTSLVSVFTGLLQGRLVLDAEMARYLETGHGVDAQSPMALLGISLGSEYEQHAQGAAATLRRLLSGSNAPAYAMLPLPAQRMLLLVFYLEHNLDWLAQFLQISVFRLFQQQSAIPAQFVYAVNPSLDLLRQSFARMTRSLPWGITLGSGVMMLADELETQAGQELPYPLLLEKKCVDALCNLEFDGFTQRAMDFLAACTAERYPPEAVKKAVTRFVLTLLNLVKHLHYETYRALEEAAILQAIQEATTRGELESILRHATGQMQPRAQDETGPLVNKAKQLIAEYYHQGITLEEIADMLHVTPEHVSAQFSKDLGTNFSAYIRSYRIRKAKELLLSTDLRMYEVAKRVGYNDPRHFSKVFKESEGILPAEYRRRQQRA